MERRKVFWLVPALVCDVSCRRAPTLALRDGDIIFQESSSRQSDMVRALTNSRWTHVGVIFKEQGRDVVLEAATRVQRTPLEAFTARGRKRLYVVKRLHTDAPDTAKLRRVAQTFVGRPYDLKFRWDDGSLYCSELVHKLFQLALGVRLGKLQRADEMNLNDARVQRALAQRFRGAAFDPAEPVVTPDSIFNDGRLAQVYP